jgi:hypothetical protein
MTRAPLLPARQFINEGSIDDKFALCDNHNGDIGGPRELGPLT